MVLLSLAPIFLAQLAAMGSVPAGTADVPFRTVFDVREFGANPDGITVDTEAVQQAIDAATVSGGGTVLVAGGYFVIGTIYLKDNVTLHVGEGASLMGSTDIRDYAEDTHKIAYADEQHMDRCLIFARNAVNISITGTGTIDGRGGREHFPNPGCEHRPMLIRFLECRHLRMRDVTLVNPASWTSAWLYCEDIVVDGVRIHSRANWNGDGLDFDGCRNVRVSNCTFDTSDDSICLQASRADQPCRDIVITNCIFESHWAGVRIGLLSLGDIENVVLTNCIFRNINDAGLKIQSCEGGVMKNMVFSNLVMYNVPRPVLMTFNRWRMGVDTPLDVPPMTAMGRMQFSDIRVDNAALAGVPCGIVLSGVPGHYIEDISFHNISMLLPGGGTLEEAAAGELPSFVDKRPEFSVLGEVIPFAGFYARHVRGLTVTELRFEAAAPEKRPAVVCADTPQLDFRNVSAGEGFSEPERFRLNGVRDQDPS